MKTKDIVILLMIEAVLGILIMFGDKLMNYTLPQDKMFYMLSYLIFPILMFYQAQKKE